MQTVYLEGNLAKFGNKWETSCSSVSEILRLIECQTEGFRAHLIKAAEAGIEYQVTRGKDVLQEEELFMTIGEEDIIITELPAGSKGVGKVIAGIIMIVAAVYYVATTGDIATAAELIAAIGKSSFFVKATILVGASLAMAGISEMMMPDPSVDGMESNRNYLFSGPANTVTQGQAVPLAYGELIVGGAPISLAFSRTPLVLDGGEVGGTVGTSPIIKETVNLTGGDTNNIEGTPGTNPPRRDPIMDFIADDEAFNILEYIGHVGL